MRVKLGGKPWKIAWKAIRKNDGLCCYDIHEIWLARRLRDENELETAIHEAMHAIAPQWGEEAIEQAAEELADMLWMMGYRRVEK